MKKKHLLEDQTVHLWQVKLNDFFDQESYFSSMLNAEEMERANRFHFPIHRQRFIIARAMLRQILSVYLNLSPQDIVFAYGHRGKPYLKTNPINLNFNVSHSEDFAVYALTANFEIGVDIQKMDRDFKEPIAKRFFSQNEYLELVSLPLEQQSSAFFCFWACKEAVIKAIGEGLYLSLSDFDVTLKQHEQWISLKQGSMTELFFVKHFLMHENYQFAFATNQSVKKILYFEWSLDGPQGRSPQFI